MPNAKNHYETLQLNPNATQETIERMFRFMASQNHPDAGGDKETFNILVKAFETLRDPISRAAYDIRLEKEQHENNQLHHQSQQAGSDTLIRHKLLCLFYARRRQSQRTPALGAITVEKMMNLPEEVMNFHLWYFKEKGWIRREEYGGFSITADGVDHVEARELELNQNLRIEMNQSRSPRVGSVQLPFQNSSNQPSVSERC